MDSDSLAVALVGLAGVAIAGYAGHASGVRQWRLERRHDSYAGLLDAYSRASVTLTLMASAMADGAVGDPGLLAGDADDQVLALQAAVHRVELIGSPSMTEHAKRLLRAQTTFLVELGGLAASGATASTEAVRANAVQRQRAEESDLHAFVRDGRAELA